MAEELKKNIFNEYDYFSNLDPSQQKFVRKQLSLQPYLYSVVVSTVSDAYEEMGQKDKAYQYIVNSITLERDSQTLLKDFRLWVKKGV
jgi:hypothetical protein